MSIPASPSPSAPSAASKQERAQVALRVVDQISAMVAYWDADLRCVFSNEAYHHWFGKGPGEMIGIRMQDLLGPLFEKNLPYIQGALAGEPQIFERQIPLPGGGYRDSIACYTPDVRDGRVVGFSVHVADVSRLREREQALAATIEGAISALARTKGSFRSKQLADLRLQLVQVLDKLKRPDHPDGGHKPA